MEEQKKIRLEFGTVQKITRPILGNAVLNESGAYIIKNPALVGKVYSVVCPQCQKVILVKAPAAKRYKVSCKGCGTSISFIGKEHSDNQNAINSSNDNDRDADNSAQSIPTQKYSVRESSSSRYQTADSTTSSSQEAHTEGTNNNTHKYGKPNAKIVWGGLFSKKSFDIIRMGEYYIGRDDDEIKSDVSIKDEYVSRRSLLLEAIPKGGNECMYKLTVKNATNPILVNGQEKVIGESIYLNYGDTILVGNTTLSFKKRQ